MEHFLYEDEVSSEDFVSWCVRDSQQLKDDFLILRPTYAGTPPACWVEELLGALDYKVAYCTMDDKQLGLCDTENRHIFVNSRSKHDRKIDRHYKSSTLAHELGHVRLHERELQEAIYQDQELAWARRRYREREANTYASLFLIDSSVLERHPLAKNILEARANGKELSSSTIWTKIYGLARFFAVSPTMMMKRLVDLNWIEKTCSYSKSGKVSLGIKRSYY